MDREALVLRNRHMTEAFHATPVKHLFRRRLLTVLSHVPISRQRPLQKERILLIRPDHLGDLLLATPAIHALRMARPHSEIHALVGPWSADVLANNTAVDAVLTVRFPAFDRARKRSWRSPYEQAVQVARHLRRIGYTGAVIMRPDHWWGAMVAFLAGIRQRVGYDHSDVAPFLTHRIVQTDQHAVRLNLQLVERWTGPIPDERVHYAFSIGAAEKGYIDGYLREWDIEPDQPIFCIHPGSGTWVKRWGEGAWAEVADTLIDQLDAPVVLTGGDHEAALVKTIANHMQHRACLAVGDTDIHQLAALYQRARVVLGPDSGPLHLAAAVGTPTVALFGAADPVEFSPWGPAAQHKVLTSDIGCRPCRVLDWGGDNPAYHPCVRDISVGQVLDAARRTINASL